MHLQQAEQHLTRSLGPRRAVVLQLELVQALRQPTPLKVRSLSMLLQPTGTMQRNQPLLVWWSRLNRSRLASRAEPPRSANQLPATLRPLAGLHPTLSPGPHPVELQRPVPEPASRQLTRQRARRPYATVTDTNNAKKFVLTTINVIGTPLAVT